jgi:hypothetical protein
MDSGDTPCLKVAHGCSDAKVGAFQVSRKTWNTSFSTGTIDYMGT